jgi:MFS family permease
MTVSATNETAAVQGRAGSPWWAVAVFCFAAIVSYLDRQALNLVVDPLRATLQISDTDVSLLQGAAFAVIYATAGLPLGRLADRVRRRNLVIAGVVLWSLATIWCGLAGSFAELFLARLLVGVGEAALAPCVTSMIADLFPPARRGTATSCFLMGMLIGSAASIAVSGAVLQWASAGELAGVPLLRGLEPWRASLVLMGLPGFVLVALLLTLREPPRATLRAGATQRLRDVVRHFAGDRAVLLPLYLGLGLLSIGDFAMMSWAPSLLLRSFAYTPVEVGAALGAVGVATGIAGTMLGGLLSDLIYRRGYREARLRIAAIASLLCIPGAAVAAAPTGSAVIAVLAIWMLASAVGGSVGITAVQDVLPPSIIGTGSALIAFCNITLGLGVGPTLVALASDHLFGGSVGAGLSAVMVPAAAAASVLFAASTRAYLRTRANGA